MTEKILRGIDYQPSLDKFNSLGEFFFELGKKHGDKICQIDADLDKSETYSSVWTRSVRVAINLEKKGITSKDVISTCSYNSLDNTIPIIAASYLGAKTVNFDPTLSVRHTKHLIDLVRPRIIFVQEECLSLMEGALAGLDLYTEIVLFEKSNKYESFQDMVLPCSNQDQFRPKKVDQNDVAVMFFSSGTTGLPKAICHSHYSFLVLTDIIKNFDHDFTAFLHFTTFYWISGMFILSTIYMHGGTRVFARTFDGERTFKMIEKYKLTGLFVAPVYTYKLTSVENPERFDVSSFKFLLTGGTSMSPEQFKNLTALFPKAQILFGYGLSEVGLVSLFHPKDYVFIKTKIGSSGTVGPLCSVKVVDVDTEETLGPYQKGEFRVKAPSLMKGYYKMDSSSCFDSEGYLKTGDVGYYDEDGCLYVVERIKEMFKYLSWHIVPSSIEAVLLEHDAIAEAVVFGIPRGEEGEIPAACVVLKDGYNVDEENIEKFVEERVSDREKLRGGVIFLKELPRTPSGKLIRNEARNIAIKTM